jgi:hypothetical protein
MTQHRDFNEIFPMLALKFADQVANSLKHIGFNPKYFALGLLQAFTFEKLGGELLITPLAMTWRATCIHTP